MCLERSSNVLDALETVLGPASSHICYQYTQLITPVRLQAYHEMAAFLTEQSTMLTRKRVILEPPAELEEKLRRPIQKLKGLVQGAALTEQVQSLLSYCSSVEEQVCICI